MPAAEQAARAASLTITELATVTEVPARTAALADTDPADWSPGDFAYYVTAELERLHGPQLPCPGESRILSEYFTRFGVNSVRIARAAFEAHRGMWVGAPVTVRRFSPGHDEFFSRPILRELGLA